MVQISPFGHLAKEKLHFGQISFCFDFGVIWFSKCCVLGEKTATQKESQDESMDFHVVILMEIYDLIRLKNNV